MTGVAHARLKLAILLTYVIFAILLNSVGTVILQSIDHYGVSKGQAATLEGFKDLPIAIVSLLVASFLPRLGFRNGMMIGLAMVAAACVAMPLVDQFWMTRLLFAATGTAFALAKVSVYSLVGLLTDSPRRHASLLNTIEGVFMLGVLSGYWIFAAFIDPGDPGGWLTVYWWLAGAAVAAVALVAASPFDERGATARDDDPAAAAPDAVADFMAMLRLAALPMTIAFVASAFLYVLIEQGIGTWLPTLNREVLGLSPAMSVQAASIFAAGLAAGRLGAGVLVRRTGWLPLMLGCLAAMALLLLGVLPLAEASAGTEIGRWADAPLAAFLLPLIGLAMAPIYPTLNSAVLSALRRGDQSKMVGLIVVFSALGGTTGSLIVGRIFAGVGGLAAIWVMLAPIAVLAGTVLVLARLLRRFGRSDASAIAG